jgi:transcriptional regulator with XRE-family HTH domain
MTNSAMTNTFDACIRELQADPATAQRLAEAQPSRDLALMMVQVRKALGLTQAEFAAHAGVSQAYISKLESGTANPSIQKMAAVFRKNGVTVEMKPKLLAEAAAPTSRADRSPGAERRRLPAAAGTSK